MGGTEMGGGAIDMISSRILSLYQKRDRRLVSSRDWGWTPENFPPVVLRRGYRKVWQQTGKEGRDCGWAYRCTEGFSKWFLIGLNGLGWCGGEGEFWWWSGPQSSGPAGVYGWICWRELREGICSNRGPKWGWEKVGDGWCYDDVWEMLLMWD